MKLFSAIKAILQLIRAIRSLEQTLIAQSILRYPEMRSMPIDARFRRRDIISPLLKELYDHWVISNSGLNDENDLIDSIGNYEKNILLKQQEQYYGK